MSSVDEFGTSDPIQRTAPGMTVVDVHGDVVGRVALARVGDPAAVAVEGDVDPQDAIGDQVPHPQAGDEPTTAPDVAARLLRTGFVKIDGVGYAGADQIAAVEVGTVRLTVSRSEVTPPA